MARLAIDGEDLVLALSRWEKLGALHGDVRVPLDSVEDVTVSSRPYRELRGWRTPGTAAPGIGAYGTWRRRGVKDFVAVRPRTPAVVVHLRDAPFRRLWVSADDPEAVVSSLRPST